MALRILRLDKKEEPRASEIAKDWRKWATDNGYIKTASHPLEQGYMRITLEVWEHPSASEDAYLFFHPEIPTTSDTEILYMLNDRERLDRLVAISQHMASDLMRRIQRINDMLNGNAGSSQEAQ